MTLDIRTLNPAEMEQAETIAYQAFGNSERHNMTAALARARRDYRPEWYLGAFEDGEMTSMMRVVPARSRLNGAALSMGIVSPVASSPLHRRRGHTGRLLRWSLQHMRDAGYCLGALYTPHPAFYRRYGWEIAADERRYEFAPKDCHLAVQPAQRGRLSFVGPDDWPTLDLVYRAYTEKRNGPLLRDATWWLRWTFVVDVGDWHRDIEAVLWQDDAGAPRGYLLFNQPNPPHRDAGKVIGVELIALTADAYLNLLAFLAGHDIFEQIVLCAPSEDPLPLLFQDAERLHVRQHSTALLRVIDLPAALQARPVTDPALDVELVIAVTDACAPWNEGSWRLRASDGRCTVEPGGSAPDLEVDARWLAPLLNGYLSPSAAASAGILVAAGEDSLRRADAFFRPAHQPYFTDRF